MTVRLCLRTGEPDDDEVSSNEPIHVEVRKALCDGLGRLTTEPDELKNRLVCARHRRKRRVPRGRPLALFGIPTFVRVETRPKAVRGESRERSRHLLHNARRRTYAAVGIQGRGVLGGDLARRRGGLASPLSGPFCQV